MFGRLSTAACIVALFASLAGCGRLGYPSHRRDENDGGASRDSASADANVVDGGAFGPVSDGSRPDGGIVRDSGSVLDASADAPSAPDASSDGGLPEPVCTPGANRACGAGGFQTCSPAGTWCQCNGDSAMGSPGGWVGCRGNGLAVCTELAAGFPCYWENHPRCAGNPTCGGTYFACNRDCPAPSAADACMCAPDSTGWLGCGAGCGVCAEVLDTYPCYFVNHWACEPVSCGGAMERCDSKCPAPSDADRGSISPAP